MKNKTSKTKLAHTSESRLFPFAKNEKVDSTAELVKSFKRSHRDSTYVGPALVSSTVAAINTTNKVETKMLALDSTVPNLAKPTVTNAFEVTKEGLVRHRKKHRNVVRATDCVSAPTNLKTESASPLQVLDEDTDGHVYNVAAQNEDDRYDLEDLTSNQYILNFEAEGSVTARGEEGKQVFNAFAFDCFGSKWALQAWDPAAFHVHNLLK
jgi:hypothetical protein